MKRIWFWLKNSRIFSLPMTWMSWLVIFVYAIDGNIINGILALVGISFCQLATNLFDDYADYKKIDGNNSQQCKCLYIREGKATLNDVLCVVIMYCAIALLIGVILFFKTGSPVLWLAFVGAILTLCYPVFSRFGLSEVAVGIAFGPLLFEGVYYVMKGTFSFEVLILSLAVVMFTIGLMYTHTVLDYEGDILQGKKTLCSRFGTKERAINGVFVVYGLGYIFTFLASIIMANYFILLTFLLLPLVFDLQKSLKSYVTGGEQEAFYFRLLKARNLMVFYSAIMAISLFKI